MWLPSFWGIIALFIAAGAFVGFRMFRKDVLEQASDEIKKLGPDMIKGYLDNNTGLIIRAISENPLLFRDAVKNALEADEDGDFSAEIAAKMEGGDEQDN